MDDRHGGARACLDEQHRVGGLDVELLQGETLHGMEGAARDDIVDAVRPAAPALAVQVEGDAAVVGGAAAHRLHRAAPVPLQVLPSHSQG